MDQSIKTNVASEDSLWRRLRHTPLRDALRLRLTGRLDVPRLVASSGLPVLLQTMTLNVIRRTRLWRLEKVDVARELVVHFHDGLAAGATPEQLAVWFGEPRMVARLIRKAKKRQRPLWWRSMQRALQGAALLLLVMLAVYIVLAIRFFTSRPGPVHDYLPQINAAALAAAPEERAWPLYREALLAMPELRDEHAPQAIARRPGDERWQEVEQYLELHQSELELVRQGAARPTFGFVVAPKISQEDRELWPEMADADGQMGLIAVQMPYLGEVRRLAMLLALDARRATAAGDGGMALRNFEAIIGLMRQSRRPPTIISGLIGMAMLQLLYEAAGDGLTSSPQVFSDAQLTALAHQLAALRDEDIRVDFSLERSFFTDVVQRLYSDDGDGNGRITREGLRRLDEIMDWPHWTGQSPLWAARDLLGPAALIMMANRRDLVEKHRGYMDRLESEAVRPLWQQRIDVLDNEIERLYGDPISRMRYWPITILMPALGKAATMGEYAIAGRDALQVAIALELYRRRNGGWPSSLRALTPDLLPVIPIDRFDGAPMRYALRDGNPVVYSIGTNHVDDGGRLPTRLGVPAEDNEAARRWRAPEAAARLRANPSLAEAFVEGDWILWPPVMSRE